MRIKSVSLGTITVIAASLFFFPGLAAAQEGWSVKLGTGVAFTRDANIASASMRALGFESDHLGRTIAMNLGVSKGITRSFKLDLGATYHPDMAMDEEFTDVSVKSQIQSLNVIGSLIYGFKSNGKVKPFLGAGAGVASTKVFDLITIAKTGPFAGMAVVDCKWAAVYQPCEGDTSVGLAWQGIVGMDLQLKSDLFLDLSYRYRDLGKVKMKATKNTEVAEGQLRAHEPMITLRYLFGPSALRTAQR